MRILFCCQFYYPSIGGVQEVIRQLAERFVERGHFVTVATTKLPSREFHSLNGVHIQEYDVSGNFVTGMNGEFERYQEFVVNGQFDAMLIYAAQQWTFDALWSVLDQIPYPKVFVPSGFSGLYESGYAKYYCEMPQILKQFDHLIFHADKYRDIDFVRELGISRFSVFPNAANEIEFNQEIDPTFRQRHGIPDNSFVFLTVGSFTGLKGHLELVKAFARLKLANKSQHATLVLNGNEIESLDHGYVSKLRKLKGLIKSHGLIYALIQTYKKLIGKSSTPKNIGARINRMQKNKIVLITDLPRTELTQAFFSADLFVFASNIEYSPLVLFESAAAGTPFLTVDVGNAIEIAKMTEGGFVCPSVRDKNGYTRVNVDVLAQQMEYLMMQPELLNATGMIGRANWEDKFTWNKVATHFETLFYQLVRKN